MVGHIPIFMPNETQATVDDIDEPRPVDPVRQYPLRAPTFTDFPESHWLPTTSRITEIRYTVHPQGGYEYQMRFRVQTPTNPLTMEIDVVFFHPTDIFHDMDAITCQLERDTGHPRFFMNNTTGIEIPINNITINAHPDDLTLRRPPIYETSATNQDQLNRLQEQIEATAPAPIHALDIISEVLGQGYEIDTTTTTVRADYDSQTYPPTMASPSSDYDLQEYKKRRELKRKLHGMVCAECDCQLDSPERILKKLGVEGTEGYLKYCKMEKTEPMLYCCKCTEVIKDNPVVYNQYHRMIQDCNATIRKFEENQQRAKELEKREKQLDEQLQKLKPNSMLGRLFSKYRTSES
jgi:hypothetical protein